MKGTVLIAAGGTGGHIFPAVAVAHELAAQGYNVSWIGTKRGLESRLVPEQGFDINYINVKSLRGRTKLQLIINLFSFVLSFLQTFYVFYKVKPKLVLGMGGYVAGPPGLVAKILRIPLLIHEQNRVFCFTNRILSKFSDKILESFALVGEDNLNKRVYTGNPVRKELMNIDAPNRRLTAKDDSKFRILIIGGSNGAATINMNVPQVLAEISKEKELEIWHQSGDKNFKPTQELYKSLSIDAKVTPFISNMRKAYEFADLVIARAGATTVAELIAVGVGSILIPYPFATDNHQVKNAQFLVDSGASFMVLESELKTSKLKDNLLSIIRDKTKALQLAQNSKSLLHGDATLEVVNSCREYF